MSRPTNPPKVPQKPDFDTTGLVFDGWGWIPDPWADVVDEEVPPNNPPVNPPTDEERAPLRIVGQNPMGPPDLAQRLLAAGVQPSPLPDPLPEGVVIVDDPCPGDDPATLRARLQERYERPERPCTYDPADGRAFVDLPPGVTARLLNTDTGQHVDLLNTGEIMGPKYDPADEEPEAEPVVGHLHIAGLGPVVRYTPPEDPGTFPGVGHWPEVTPTGTTDVTPRPEVFPPWVRCNDGRFLNTVTGEYRDPLSPGESMPMEEWRKAQRFEAQYPTDDWTPPRPEPLEYSGIPVVVDPEQEEGTVRVVSWTDQTRGFVDSLLDFPAVAPQGGPDPRNTVGGLSKKTFDPTWMDDMPVFRLGTKDKPGGFMTYGEMRKQDDATLPPGTVRAALERTVRDASTHTKEDPMPTTTIIDRAILEEVARDLPKSYASVTGWTNQIVEDPSNGPRMDRSVAKFMERVRSAALLRSYLRTLTNPDAPAEDVAAALDLLTDGDFALVDPRNVEGFKLLNALPLMKRVRA